MRKLQSPRFLVAALAVSLGLAANAYAAPAEGSPAPQMMGMHGHHGMIHGRGMARLHDELKLDAKQEALWKDADKFAQDHRATMRERFGKDHTELKAMLDKPGADLRALAKRMDDLRAEGMKDRDVVRDRWFAVYDSLNAEQKEKVRLFFKAGMERRGDKGGQGGHRMHGPMRHSQPENPAPKS